MKKLLFLLAIITLYIACVKQEKNVVQQSNNSFDVIPSLTFDNAYTNAYNTEQVKHDVTIAQHVQEIIENYASTVWNPRYYKVILEFQIEGNFTDSGNREIIGFYGILSDKGWSLDSVFCFVLDSSGEKIENVYAIDYLTIGFLEQHEAMTGLSKDFGSYIICRDRVIGCYGDFNNNGRDEMYLFSLSGINFVPLFFEFNGIEFAKIIELEWMQEVSIINIDSVEKIITLRERFFEEYPDIEMHERINSYIWNESAQRYVLLSSEIKIYRWNRELKQFVALE